MKKIAIISLCFAAAAFSASAQMSVIKEAKGSFKPGGDYVKFIETITPAFTNPETAQLAETWYVAGNEGFKNYDHLLGLLRLGQEVDQKAMGQSLIKGYEFYNKALPLDTVVDEKGKVKAKYSKNIIKDLAAHHDDYYNAGNALWTVKDYPGAYEAWGIYLAMPDDARLGKLKPAQLADTIKSTINFNRALAAWQADDLANAMVSFDKAIELKYDDPMIFEYAAEVARLMGNKEKQYQYAETGYNTTGDPKYLSVMINHYIDQENYAKANDLLETAINSVKGDREKAYLYVLKGIIAERTNPEAAKGGAGVADNYLNATKLDPKYGGAFYNYGRILLVKANQLDEDSGNMSQGEYNKFKNETLVPLMKEAAEYIEKGYELDNTLTPAIQLLQSIYYMLGDEQNLQRVKNM